MVSGKGKNAAESLKKRSPAVVREDSKTVTRRMSLKYRLVNRRTPEIALFDTDKERKVALRCAESIVRRTARGRWFWFLFFLIWVSFVLAEPLAAYPRAEKSVLCLLILLFGVAWYSLRRPLVRRSLREQLAAKGVPICVGCGYDLRAQIEPRCPECGSAFDEKLLNHSEEEPERRRPRA